MTAARLDRRLELAILAILFFSYAYFYQSGGWNENSRMDLVRAIVHDQSFSIDPYHHNTGDKARVGDRYYSDKAPGLSLLAAPVYLLTLPLRAVFTTDHDFLVFATYLVTALTVGLAAAVLGVLVFRAGRKLGASPRGALVGSLAWGLGTTAFPFSTQFFGHQVAALCAFGAFWLAWKARDGGAAPRFGVWVGVLGAAAALIEFPMAPVALLLLGYLWGRRGPALGVLAGLAVPAVLLFGYLTLAFGGPLNVGYQFLADPASRDDMLSRGLFGVTYPKVGVMFELLIGRYRGLLPYSPVLLFALLGFGIAWRRAEFRRELVTAGLVCLYFLLFVSSYEWWQGGSSFGSRHLVPLLPFLAMPLGLAFDAWPKTTSVATVASVAMMLVVTAVSPKPSERAQSPLFGTLLPAFAKGRVAANDVCPETGKQSRRHVSFLRNHPTDAFNLGMVVGGRGPISLLPLLSLWLAAGWSLYRRTGQLAAQPEAASRDPDDPEDRAQRPR